MKGLFKKKKSVEAVAPMPTDHERNVGNYYKMITNISKLPLQTFIDCFVDHDYSGIVEGTAPPPLILLTWNELIEQYNDAISKGDDTHEKYISVHSEYLKARSRYELAIKLIELLNAYFEQGIVVPKWIADLNKLVEMSYVFDANKKDEFINYLKRCNSRNKGNLTRYELAEAHLSEILRIQNLKKENGTEGNVIPDHSYFIQIMLNLKQMEGREIPYTISTLEFCMLVGRYREYRKAMEAKKNENKSKR